jgi:hypothetical protein
MIVPPFPLGPVPDPVYPDLPARPFPGEDDEGVE